VSLIYVHKKLVFRRIYDALKQGGELYFSDVYADRRIPKHLQEDRVLWGECLSGALYWEDFRRILNDVGFRYFSVVSAKPIGVQNEEIIKQLGEIHFSSITIRAFKSPLMEDRCEDYGQSVTYLGTMEDFPHSFHLDNGHTFVTGESATVCRNTAVILSDTRFGKHFKLEGDGINHLGLYRNKSGDLFSNSGAACGGGSCC